MHDMRRINRFTVTHIRMTIVTSTNHILRIVAEYLYLYFRHIHKETHSIRAFRPKQGYTFLNENMHILFEVSIYMDRLSCTPPLNVIVFLNVF